MLWWFCVWRHRFCAKLLSVPLSIVYGVVEDGSVVNASEAGFWGHFAVLASFHAVFFCKIAKDMCQVCCRMWRCGQDHKASGEKGLFVEAVHG